MIMNKDVRYLMTDVVRESVLLNFAVIGFEMEGLELCIEALGKEFSPMLNKMLIASKTLPFEEIKADACYEDALKSLTKDIDMIDNLLSDQEFLKKDRRIEKLFEKIKPILIEVKNNLTRDEGENNDN